MSQDPLVWRDPIQMPDHFFASWQEKGSDSQDVANNETSRAASQVGEAFLLLEGLASDQGIRCLVTATECCKVESSVCL